MNVKNQFFTEDDGRWRILLAADNVTIPSVLGATASTGHLAGFSGLVIPLQKAPVNQLYVYEPILLEQVTMTVGGVVYPVFGRPVSTGTVTKYVVRDSRGTWVFAAVSTVALTASVMVIELVTC